MMIEDKPAPRLRKEMTKNGRGVSVKLTESEYKEWVILGKGKWLRSFLKDSRFQRGQA
jgi:predicted nucleic acid-binding Zn finger protein